MKKYLLASVVVIASMSGTGLGQQLGRVDDAGRAEVIMCDDAAAKVSVNLFDKRNLHLVISDQNIMDYFRKATEFELLDYRGGRGPFTFSGYANDPVSSAETFGGFLGEGRAGSFYNGFGMDSFILQSRVYRHGKGLKIELWRDYVVSVGEGGLRARTGIFQVANWHFRDCMPATAN